MSTSHLDVMLAMKRSRYALYFCETRSYAALRAADLDWITGPGYSLGQVHSGEKPWKTNLEPWQTNLEPWPTMETNQKPWKTMKLPWKTMETNQKPWNYLEKPWKPTKNHETTLKNHVNKAKTMKNYETTLKNHGNPKTPKPQNPFANYKCWVDLRLMVIQIFTDDYLFMSSNLSWGCLLKYIKQVSNLLGVPINRRGLLLFISFWF